MAYTLPNPNDQTPQSQRWQGSQPTQGNRSLYPKQVQTPGAPKGANPPAGGVREAPWNQQGFANPPVWGAGAQKPRQGPGVPQQGGPVNPGEDIVKTAEWRPHTPGALPTGAATATQAPATATTKIPRVDPSISASGAAAIAEFQKAARTLLNRDLTPEELASMRDPAQTGDVVTGANYNYGLDRLEQFAGAQQGPTGPTGPAGPPAPPPPVGAYTPTPGYNVEAPPPMDGRAGGLGEIDDATQRALNEILANPGTMTPEVLAKMKASAKTTALNRRDQLRGDAQGNLAGRGFSGGGLEAGVNRAADSDLISNLLNSDRDLEVDAVATNRSDTIAALGASNAYTANKSGRDLTTANHNMARAEFQQGQRSEDRSAQLRDYLASVGVDLDAQKFTEAKKQFKTATGLDLMRFLESQRQFDVSGKENSRQFNVNAGLTTAQLNMQNQAAIAAWWRANGGG